MALPSPTGLGQLKEGIAGAVGSYADKFKAGQSFRRSVRGEAAPTAQVPEATQVQGDLDALGRRPASEFRRTPAQAPTDTVSEAQSTQNSMDALGGTRPRTPDATTNAIGRRVANKAPTPGTPMNNYAKLPGGSVVENLDSYLKSRLQEQNYVSADGNTMFADRQPSGFRQQVAGAPGAILTRAQREGTQTEADVTHVGSFRDSAKYRAMSRRERLAYDRNEAADADRAAGIEKAEIAAGGNEAKNRYYDAMADKASSGSAPSADLEPIYEDQPIDPTKPWAGTQKKFAGWATSGSSAQTPFRVAAQNAVAPSEQGMALFKKDYASAKTVAEKAQIRKEYMEAYQVDPLAGR